MFNKKRIEFFLNVVIAKGPGSKLVIHNYLRDNYGMWPQRFSVLLTAKQLVEKNGYLSELELRSALNYSRVTMYANLKYFIDNGFMVRRSGYLFELTEYCYKMIDDVSTYFGHLSDSKIKKIDNAAARASPLHS